MTFSCSKFQKKIVVEIFIEYVRNVFELGAEILRTFYQFSEQVLRLTEGQIWFDHNKTHLHPKKAFNYWEQKFDDIFVQIREKNQ